MPANTCNIDRNIQYIETVDLVSTGTINNYSMSSRCVAALAAAALKTLNGMIAAHDGQLALVSTTMLAGGGGAITVTAESGSAGAFNRFITAVQIQGSTRRARMFWYDPDVDRWRLM